jgi:hypothetical protein
MFALIPFPPFFSWVPFTLSQSQLQKEDEQQAEPQADQGVPKPLAMGR